MNVAFHNKSVTDSCHEQVEWISLSLEYGERWFPGKMLFQISPSSVDEKTLSKWIHECVNKKLTYVIHQCPISCLAIGLIKIMVPKKCHTVA